MNAAAETYPGLTAGSRELHTWNLFKCPRRLTVRRGSVGFLLAFYASWYNANIERLDIEGNDSRGPDDGGFADRDMTNNPGVPSFHKRGIAIDLNWRRHPYGTPAGNTFTGPQLARIQHALDNKFSDRDGPLLEWGGNWPSHPGSTAKPDPMHIEVCAELGRVETWARRRMGFPFGKGILDLNKGQAQVILS